MTLHSLARVEAHALDDGAEEAEADDGNPSNEREKEPPTEVGEEAKAKHCRIDGRIRGEAPVLAAGNGQNNCKHFVPLQPGPEPAAHHIGAPKKSLDQSQLHFVPKCSGWFDWREVRCSRRDASEEEVLNVKK